jgi:hypothetical protein
MVAVNAGTSYGTTDDELARIFDEQFVKIPEIEACSTSCPTNGFYCGGPFTFFC